MLNILKGVAPEIFYTGRDKQATRENMLYVLGTSLGRSVARYAMFDDACGTAKYSSYTG